MGQQKVKEVVVVVVCVVVEGYSWEEFGGLWHQSDQQVVTQLQLVLFVQVVHLVVELCMHGL